MAKLKKLKKSDWEILPEAQEGRIINDDMGQWKYPGEITQINSNNITMQGVPYNVLGVSNTGDTKLMKPGKNYKFKGSKVTEYPMMQVGGRMTPEEKRIIKQQRKIAKKSKYEIVPDSPSDIPESLENIDWYNWQDANKEFQRYGSPEEYYEKFPTEEQYELFQSKWRGSDLGTDRPYITADEIQMANGGLTSGKAKQMLKDKTAHGKPLTAKQKRFFGWVAGGRKDIGGELYNDGGLYDIGGNIPEAGSGYKVIRSSERKGKTHKVIGPDGTVKFFGDSKLGQHPKDPARKKAFYARHAKNLKNNPYFRAFAKKTWEEGGMLPDLMEMAAGGQFLTVGGEYHRIYKNADGDIMVNHPKEDKGKWDTINLTDKAGAKTVADGVAATKKWHRENPYAFGGNVILEKYQQGGSTWEIVPDTEWEII